MVNLCLLLILLATISLEINGTIQSKDPSKDEELGINGKEISVQEQARWLKKPGGWSKPKPCGRPGKPPCPTEGTTLPTTKPTTMKPITTTSGNGIVTPSHDEESTTTKKPKPTPSSPKPVTTTKRPQPSTDGSRPTFATTSSPEVTQSTAKTTTKRPITTRRPLPTPPHEGGMVFPDDDDDDYNPITKPTSKPIVTPTPKPTPNGDVDGDKDTEGTTPSSSTTTQSSATQECIRKCPITPEYNPVCGSDGATYSNPGRLSCAQFCGVDVTLRARGPCRSTTTTSPTTPSNGDGNDNTISECIRKCPVTSQYNPVCGSDGVTYSNLGRLNCAYNCGKKITVVSLGPCGSTTPSPTINGTTQSPLIKQCIGNCPVTSEYNPVCGSDGTTYTNPGRLICAQDCGVSVRLRARGPCSSITTTTTVAPTTESPAVRECIRKCPVTPEYSPVCGSNGVTYNNASHLRCAQVCKVAVQLGRIGRCPTRKL